MGINEKKDLYHLERYLEIVSCPVTATYSLERLLDCYVRHHQENPQGDFNLVYQDGYALKQALQKTSESWK